MSEKKIQKKHFLLFITGGLSVVLFFVLFNKVVTYTSTNEFCMLCHAHPEADASWKLSLHHNNFSGFSTRCVDCHLPPEDKTFYFLTRKAYHGFHDLYVFVTKDIDEIDWEIKRTLEAAGKFVYEDGCKKCHTNLFPSTLDELGAESHLKYVIDPKSTSCLKCHLDVGHYRGIEGLTMEEVVDGTKELFTQAAEVIVFEDFTEQIPGTPVSFNMKAIPGGDFKMGSPPDESYRELDEGPVREVKVDDFWMSEVEVTWESFFAFFSATSSQGRKEGVQNAEEEVDAITGPTPPWGAPDQGWGMGDRPAITMTHHAAQTFCSWLSEVTGKKYRLPTEAEWEYAARAGTDGPYFFEGTPGDYEDEGIINKIFGPDTSIINTYVIYQQNSPLRTQPPSVVKPNPFGLKNMLGNVAEFCSDYYDLQTYAKYPQGVINNPRGPRDGQEHVIRGGSFKDTPKNLRIADREHTRSEEWKDTDPQIPKSIWWYSDCNDVGIRIVCDTDILNEDEKK
jgi:formylglycine-generating enzyme